MIRHDKLCNLSDELHEFPALSRLHSEERRRQYGSLRSLRRSLVLFSYKSAKNSSRVISKASQIRKSLDADVRFAPLSYFWTLLESDSDLLAKLLLGHALKLAEIKNPFANIDIDGMRFFRVVGRRRFPSFALYVLFPLRSFNTPLFLFVSSILYVMPVLANNLLESFFCALHEASVVCRFCRVWREGCWRFTKKPYDTIARIPSSLFILVERGDEPKIMHHLSKNGEILDRQMPRKTWDQCGIK